MSRRTANTEGLERLLRGAPLTVRRIVDCGRGMVFEVCDPLEERVAGTALQFTTPSGRLVCRLRPHARGVACGFGPPGPQRKGPGHSACGLRSVAQVGSIRQRLRAAGRRAAGPGAA